MSIDLSEDLLRVWAGETGGVIPGQRIVFVDQAIAKNHGVTQSQVSNIVRRKQWRNV